MLISVHRKIYFKLGNNLNNLLLYLSIYYHKREKFVSLIIISVNRNGDRKPKGNGQNGRLDDVCPQKPRSLALSDRRSVDLVTGAIYHSRWLASHAVQRETRVTTLPSLLATFDWLCLRLR